jgi:hypothetical protein
MILSSFTIRFELTIAHQKFTNYIMMMKTNNKWGLIIFVLLCLTILLAEPSKLSGQSQIFLEESELITFDLMRQSKIYWFDPDKNLRTAEDQEWKAFDSENNQYVYIQYYVFNSIPEAINGTAKLSQRFAVSYVWGSPVIFTVGEATWSSLKNDVNNSSALFFVKGNVGIQVFVHGLDNKKLIKTVTDKLVTKLDRFLQSTIKSEDGSNIVDSLIYKKLNIGYNYTDSISKQSHWIVDSTQYKSGLRKEWSNGISTIGIDACLCNNDDEANMVAKMKSKICSISDHVYNLSDQNYIEFVKLEWELYLRTEISNRTFSIVSTKNNIAFHLYCYNIDKNDFEIINYVFNQLVKK